MYCSSRSCGLNHFIDEGKRWLIVCYRSSSLPIWFGMSLGSGGILAFTQLAYNFYNNNSYFLSWSLVHMLRQQVKYAKDHLTSVLRKVLKIGANRGPAWWPNYYSNFVWAWNTDSELHNSNLLLLKSDLLIIQQSKNFTSTSLFTSSLWIIKRQENFLRSFAYCVSGHNYPLLL